MKASLQTLQQEKVDASVCVGLGSAYSTLYRNRTDSSLLRDSVSHRRSKEQLLEGCGCEFEVLEVRESRPPLIGPPSLMSRHPRIVWTTDAACGRSTETRRAIIEIAVIELGGCGADRHALLG